MEEAIEQRIVAQNLTRCIQLSIYMDLHQSDGLREGDQTLSFKISEDDVAPNPEHVLECWHVELCPDQRVSKEGHSLAVLSRQIRSFLHFSPLNSWDLQSKGMLRNHLAFHISSIQEFQAPTNSHAFSPAHAEAGCLLVSVISVPELPSSLIADMKVVFSPVKPITLKTLSKGESRVISSLWSESGHDTSCSSQPAEALMSLPCVNSTSHPTISIDMQVTPRSKTVWL
jgi:hypothetical protein